MTGFYVNSMKQIRHRLFKISLYVMSTALSMIGFSIYASQAATPSPKNLISGFEKELKKWENAILLSTNTAERNKELNRNSYLAQLKEIENNYAKSLADIQNNLQLQLDQSNRSLSESKLKWDQINKVRLTTGFFGADLSRISNVLECIPPYSDGSSPFLLVKRNCANNGGFPAPGDRIPNNPLSVYGGADWQKDDVTTVHFTNSNDKYLSEGIKFGFIVPFNPSEFAATRQKISNSQFEIDRLSKEIATAKKSADENRYWQKLQAEEKWIIGDNSIDDALTKDVANFENKIESLKFGLKAAKRAAKQSGNLKTSFVTALKFAYNVNALDELASAPIAYTSSLKSLRNIVEVTKLSEEADLVDLRYSQTGAIKINKICGDTFIKERKFKDLLSVSMSIYSNYMGK